MGIFSFLNKKETEVIKTPEKAKAANTIKVPQQLFRHATDFERYRSAVVSAENIIMPIRLQLYELYNQAALDSHISAAIQQRVNLIVGSKFCVYQGDTEVEDKTRLIRVKWFREFVSYALESLYYGHSLIQFEDIIIKDGVSQFKEVELVPRQYIKPEFNFLGQSTGATPPNGIDYTELPWSNWCISVGKKRDLGLFLKLVPLYLWKKNALGAWAEFIEKFGTPIRVGKTDKSDYESVQKMEGMLRNMGVAAWGLFGTEDSIELLESGNNDAYEVFDKMVERCNSEISKLILGQSSTTDEKSFVGSAEVHERVLENVRHADQLFIESVLNDQLVPLMNNLGFGLDGMEIRIEQEDEWNLEAKGKFDIELIKSGKYKLSPEYIKEKYGTEVEEVKEPAPNDNMGKYKDVLSNLYS